MALNLNKNLKLYYSIKEVAEMFDLPESTLRYWVRQYQEKDIEQIRLIHNLVKVRGFKLAAARKMLTHNKQGVDKTADILYALLAVRTELQTLKKQLDSLQ